MSITKKEMNGYLFDQLSIIERIEDALIEDNVDAPKVKACIELEKEHVKRKLYQNLPTRSRL